LALASMESDTAEQLSPAEYSWLSPCATILEVLASRMPSPCSAWWEFASLACVSQEWRATVDEWRSLVVELELAGRISDAALLAIAACPRLETLHLSRRHVLRNPASAACHCAAAYAHDVDSCRKLSDEAVRRLVAGCSSLRRLDLGSCEQLSDGTLGVVAERCGQLCSLDLSNCRGLTDDGLLALARHGLGDRLRELDLHACCMSAAALEALGSHFPALEAVHLSSCVETSDTAVQRLADGCTRLRHLDVFGCVRLSDVAATAVAAGCAALETLHLSECDGVSDVGLRVLVSTRGAGLAHLHLFGCRHLSDDALHTALASCPLLQSLDLSSTAVGEPSVVAVARGCARLHTLFLFDCPRVTESALLALAASPLQLRMLDLSACSHACTEAALTAIVAAGWQLHTFKCFGGVLLGDEACAGLVTRCGHALRRLDMSGCDLTDAALDAIGTHCLELCRLDVAGCPQLTEAGLSRVLHACPALHTLGQSEAHPPQVYEILERRGREGRRAARA